EQTALPPHAHQERPHWEAPLPCWRQTALAFVQYCCEVLWSEQGKHALDYLRERGLVDQIIKEARLGYYPRTMTGSAKAWGRRVHLPQGIVIPWFFQGEIWRITIRDERVCDGNARYKQVAGGSNGLYLADSLKPKQPIVVMTEGELDALSLLQTCRDLVAVVATGTTEGSHTPRWVSLLACQERVLITFDAEEKGDQAAQWWLKRLERAQRLRPWWKDANQMLQDGADLRQWIVSHLTANPSEGPHEEPELARTCDICGNEVERYDPQGNAYCGPCWQAQTQQDQEDEPQQETLQPGEVPQPAIHLISHATFVQDVLALAQQIAHDGHKRLALDLETTSLDAQEGKIVSLALGLPGNVTILDLRPYESLPQEEQFRWRQALMTLLQLPEVMWIGHNLKFDWTFLQVRLGIRLRQVYDTMLVEHLLRCTGLEEHGKVSVSLLETAKRYGFSVTKEQRSWFERLDTRTQEWTSPFPPEQLTYMAQDIEVPCQIAERQAPLVQRYGLEEVVRLENQTLPAIASMEIRGALIDQVRWKQVLERKRERQAVLEQELVETLGAALFAARQRSYPEHIKQYEAYQQALHAEEKRLMHVYNTTSEVQRKSTWSAFLQTERLTWKAQHPEPKKPESPTTSIKLTSSDQLIEALGQLDIHVTSTKEEVLEEYEQRYPVIGRLLQWRKLSHFCSSFGENLLAFIGPDGRFHATFHQMGAVSGRIICVKPGLQQIPKKRTQEPEEEDVRRCFIAPAGYRLLKTDLSNIELRILAEVAHDQVMLRLFAQGEDLHDAVARLLFKLSPETDTRQYLYKGVVVRDIAKTINYGLSYGMGPQRLANRVGVSIEEARGMMRTFFETYSGVANWLRQAAQRATREGYVASLSGRKRFFHFEGRSRSERGSLERSAKNHGIQGSNADILKRAMALLYETLPEQVSIILTVHDEIVLECPEAMVAEATEILKSAMMQACRHYLKIVHIPEPEVLDALYWKKG
ncbi:MAG TPA: DNA polymerase, partial [Ktedonobacteraceae bacterium]|nr:DNA polymerase [Ktedonobacteraceae bacterium]